LSKFFEYFFFSIYYWNQIIPKGSSKSNFNAPKLQNLLIPLSFKDGKPDLEKQKQIAEYLDNLHEKIKRLEELQRTT